MSLYSQLRAINRIILGPRPFKYLTNTFPNIQRHFATAKTQPSHDFGLPVFETKVFKDFVDSSVSLYKSNQAAVDSEMIHLLNSHKLLLFLEGSVDSPKSLCAANVVKMFTLLQVVNFHTVDVLSNKEVYGFLCTKFGEPVRNVLFKNGNPLAGHDELLELFKKGKLLEALGVPRASQKGVPKEFKGHLPVANY